MHWSGKWNFAVFISLDPLLWGLLQVLYHDQCLNDQAIIAWWCLDLLGWCWRTSSWLYSPSWPTGFGSYTCFGSPTNKLHPRFFIFQLTRNILKIWFYRWEIFFFASQWLLSCFLVLYWFCIKLWPLANCCLLHFAFYLK